VEVVFVKILFVKVWFVKGWFVKSWFVKLLFYGGGGISTAVGVVDAGRGADENTFVDGGGKWRRCCC
jgi:hypothetical protein